MFSLCVKKKLLQLESRMLPKTFMHSEEAAWKMTMEVLSWPVMSSVPDCAMGQRAATWKIIFSSPLNSSLFSLLFGHQDMSISSAGPFHHTLTLLWVNYGMNYRMNPLKIMSQNTSLHLQGNKKLLRHTLNFLTWFLYRNREKPISFLKTENEITTEMWAQIALKNSMNPFFFCIVYLWIKKFHK